MRSKEDTRASISAGIILGKKKQACTFTLGQVAALGVDICPRAIHSIPFWRWIRACASTYPVSCSTRNTARLPWRPLTPATIHWWLQGYVHLRKCMNPWNWLFMAFLYKTTSRFTTERFMAFIYYSNPMNWRNQEPHRVGASYQFTYNFSGLKGIWISWLRA